MTRVRHALALPIRRYSEVMPQVYVGTSGWNYKHWRGDFYPKELGPQQWLEVFSEHFDTVEINKNFFLLPPPKDFSKLRRPGPQDLTFAVKASPVFSPIKRPKG